MEASILTSVKKVVGIADSYTAFDEDILIHINSAFGTLNQLGLGPVEGFVIEDKDAEWDSYGESLTQTSLVKTYVQLKVRLLFDPPSTSFHLEAAKTQIQEYEWRLNVNRENALEVSP